MRPLQLKAEDFAAFDEGAALRWLFARNQFTMKLGLDTIRALLDHLGNPQMNLRMIHVAGTNGKGSVCGNLAALLRGCGYQKVGLYTSPHLVSFRERIRVNTIPISLLEVRDFIRFVGPFCEEIAATYFEIATAMALDYFQKQRCEAVVLETGLGGRLDATNAVIPRVSVLTPVDIDHVAQLGPHLEGIFAEKAAILKPGVPMIVATQVPGLVEPLVAQAKQLGSPLILAENHMPRQHDDWEFTGQRRTWTFSKSLRPEAHQRENLILACLALEAFAHERVLDLVNPEACLTSALPSGRSQYLQLPGRLPLWLDGAHNPHGLKSLVQSLKQRFPKRRWLICFGMMADKSVSEALSILRELPGQIHWAPLWELYPRAFKPDSLPDSAVFPLKREDFLASLLTQNPENKGEGKWDGVLVCGSLYLLGEVITLVCKDYPELSEFVELAEDRRRIS